MKPLNPPDSHHLLAAQGWLELGNFLEANAELERISAAHRSHPDVLSIRWHIYERAEKWDVCLDIATAHLKLAPKSSDAWIRRSIALHSLKRTQDAYNNLASVSEKFPGIWQIPYNLACYCSVLGNFEEAKDWFKKAVVINEKQVQRAGIDDPDLKPMWDSMCTTWKREDS